MNRGPSSFEELLKLLAVLGAVGSFVWGVWVWYDKSEKELAQLELDSNRLAESRRNELAQVEMESVRLAESRRIEATKPFLERQLSLYIEASQVAAVLATSSDKAQRAGAKERFWRLYWGELALVENSQVETAMVALGSALNRNADRSELEQLSLQLAKACRNSLDKSWGINAWSNPDEASRKSGQQHY